MAVKFDPKDPDDIDDFTLNWQDQLASGETITDATATVVSSSVTVADNGVLTISGPRTTARVSGGTEGEQAEVRFRITTSSGRQLDQTASFAIVVA